MQLQYINLRAHIKNKIGQHKFYDAIPKLNLPQKINTHCSINSLMSNIKQGSASYRKIIARSHTRSDLHNPSKWRSKLNDNRISRAQLKQSKVNLHSKYLSSDIANSLTLLTVKPACESLMKKSLRVYFTLRMIVYLLLQSLQILKKPFIRKTT